MSYLKITRKPTATWTLDNPILDENEMGIASEIVDGLETDTGEARVGNGRYHWRALPRFDPSLLRPPVEGVKATGFLSVLTDASASITNGATIVINGAVFTFRLVADTGAYVPGVNIIDIGYDPFVNATKIADALNASTNALINVATYMAIANVVHITYDTAGTIGNSYTLANSSDSSIVRSGPTLTGGVDGLSASSVGESMAADATAFETGTGTYRTTVLSYKDQHVALADHAATVAYGSAEIYTMPAGAILIAGATASLALTKSSVGVNTDWDGDFGIGTTAADNDATLATTEQDIIPTTPTPQAVAGATTAKGVSTATESGVIYPDTGTPISIYLNILVDDTDHNVTGTACDIIVNGTITIHWMNLGEHA